jgi:hypothetical protein
MPRRGDRDGRLDYQPDQTDQGQAVKEDVA